MVKKALAELSGEFQAMYSREGRPSIPPEKLLRALLLQVLYTIRSARLLMENRHGLVISPRLTAATGTAEREAAVGLVEGIPGRHRITVGGDKAYDTRGFVQSLRGLKAVPHVAQNCNGRKSAIDGRTTRHPGYAVSQRLRKRVEEIFGWMKTVGNLRKTRHRGEDRVDWVFSLTAAAYNLVRIRNLTAAVSP
jgi:hypothetical protein